jgi:ATPase subunit of ABC transporter with duplicated ATPase domains
MGRNGAGKSTLLKMIAGATAPDKGTVRLGASLKMGYFAQQSLDVLDPDLTVIEQLQNDFPQDGLGALRTLAGAFQFSGDDADKRIRALSGGEKSRLAMARMLYNPPNFLVLDEPTNHLDLATKEMLVEALKEFEGTMIFVSHDRMFLRGLGSRVLELGGEGVPLRIWLNDGAGRFERVPVVRSERAPPIRHTVSGDDPCHPWCLAGHQRHSGRRSHRRG